MSEQPLPITKQKIVKKYRGLGTNIVLTLFGTNDEQILDRSNQLIRHFEDIFTVNREVSELMTVNQNAGIKPIQVSYATYHLVKTAIEVSVSNRGFNAAIGPLVKLWAIGFKDAHIPSDAEIRERLALINPAKVQFDDIVQTIYLKEKGMEIDLGGIAKGYIADRIRDYWRSLDLRAGIINLGGNLLFYGTSPNSTDGLWRIGVQDPDSKRGDILASVTLPECSAVTSGIYERKLEVNGKEYHHILDPITGQPKETDIVGVTVFTKNSIDAEIKTTEYFFNGPEYENLENSNQVLGAVFVLKDKKIVVKGIKTNQFNLINQAYSVIFEERGI